MRDEDDDLLRAAEELGIDLSGVRAGAAEPVTEEEDVPVEAAAEDPDAVVDLVGDDDIEVPDLDDPLLVDPDVDIDVDAEATAET
jgi:DNA-directed RNA polymerase subunit beta